MHKVGHAGESLAHVVKDDLHANLSRFKLGLAVLNNRLAVLVKNGNYVKHLELVVVCVLNIADVILDIIVILLDVCLERFKVVFNGGAHRAHHRSERIVNVDLVCITVVLFVGCISHSREHSGHILSCFLNSQRIGGECILLHLRNKGVDTG